MTVSAPHPPTSWPRIGIWVFHLALPVLGLWFLVAEPRYDGRWEHHGAHLWLVAGVAAVSLALAVTVRRAARVHRDARLALVALAFFAAAGFLFLHALATPKVLADTNYGFVVAAPAGLFLAALFAAASAVEWRGDRAARVLRWEGPIWLALLTLFVAWGVLSVTTVGPFARAVTPSEAHGPLVLVAIGGGVLYAATCIAYARVYRRRQAVMLLGVLTGFALLAEALVAVAYGRNWQASWWEWHLLMAGGFAFIAYSARVQYQREGAGAPAIFGAVGLDETLARIREEYGGAVDAMVDALRRRIEGAGEEGPVASQVAARFGLSEGQRAVLEQAADALVHEREDVRRLGELVAMGREATVGTDEEQFLARAFEHARTAFIRSTVAVGLLERGELRFPPALTSGPDVDLVTAGREVESSLRLPLLVQDQTAGVLVVSRPSGFSDRDRAMASSFAAQLSVSLENARLYRQIDALFRQYMAPEIVTAVLADPSQAELGGAVVEVTSLFADLRGFTSFSERTDPADVVAMLNRCFGAAVPAVLEHGGTVTQFAGDNIMAVWNAPARQPDHARRAARAGLALQERVRGVTAASGDAIAFRVGINTGSALVGNVGADVRCYTANGDSVNLAARLESLARPGTVVIGEATLEAIGPAAVVTDLGTVQVKGKSEPVRAYELLRIEDERV